MHSANGDSSSVGTEHPTHADFGIPLSSVSKARDDRVGVRMRQVTRLVRLRGMGVIAFILAVFALFATPAAAAAVPGTYTVTALASNNGGTVTTKDGGLQTVCGSV